MNIWLSNIDVSQEGNACVPNVICVYYEKGIRDDVKQGCMRFFRYLRKKYRFPSRICVYIETSEYLSTDEDEVSVFLLSSHEQPYPSIHISTGYYEAFVEKYGEDDAMASILWSIAYEFTHYFQWIANLNESPQINDRVAEKCADNIIHRYYMETVMEPRHIWRCEKWKKYRNEFSLQTGLHVSYDKDVAPPVRTACIAFCRWLRSEYDFPIRVDVYVKSQRRIIAQDGTRVCGTFFRPYNYKQLPYSKIATGDYDELIQETDKDSAILSILCTIAHELTHYFQWINKLDLTLTGEERQATVYAHKIIESYMDVYYREE